MNVDVDPAKVLYAVGVLFGVAAVLYFARDIVFELSITVRAALLFLGFVVLLAGALEMESRTAVLGSSVLAAATYLAFVVYTLSGFDVGADGTFFALLLSALLFLGLGYGVRERGLAPSRRTVGYVLLAAGIVAVALIGADVAASDVEYEIAIEDEVAVDAEGETAVGTLTVDNSFVFREPIDEPQTWACVYDPSVRNGTAYPAPVDYRIGEDWLPDSVPGGGQVVADMHLYLPREIRANVTGPVPIERAEECPGTSDEARIVVIVTGDRPAVPRPVPP